MTPRPCKFRKLIKVLPIEFFEIHIKNLRRMFVRSISSQPNVHPIYVRFQKIGNSTLSYVYVSQLVTLRRSIIKKNNKHYVQTIRVDDSIDQGREVIDSRGNPTVEADLVTEDGLFKLDPVRSSRMHECELRDGEIDTWKGVLNAVKSVNEVLAKELIGMDVRDQEAIDAKMIDLNEHQQSEPRCSAILAVSMAASAGLKRREFPCTSTLRIWPETR